MRISSPICALAVCLSSVALAACSGSMPNDVTLPASATPVSLTATPDSLEPEFIPWNGCSADRPFGLRFVIGVDGPPHVALRQLRFGFRDRFGNHFRPIVAANFGGTPIANVGPIPFPSPTSTGSTIPLPSSTPLMAVITSVGSSRTIPVSMSFPCGVFSSGTLVVIGDFDGHGSSEVRVRVGN